MSFLDEEGRPTKLLLGEFQLAFPFGDLGACFGNILSGLCDQGPCAGEACIQFRRVHARQNLSGGDHITFLDGDLGNAAGILRGDMNFFRFDPTVTGCNVSRQLVLFFRPPVIPAADGAGDEDGGNKETPITCH